jgi:hypothetical protein
MVPEYYQIQLETKLMTNTLGIHSKSEFNNKTYMYVDGELEI